MISSKVDQLDFEGVITVLHNHFASHLSDLGIIREIISLEPQLEREMIG